MTTGGHHVVRGNEWKVPSPEMMTYMSYEIYTYLYIHSHTMCIQCTVRMNTNTHSNTSTHTYTHTCMHNIYNCTHDTPPVGALHRRHMPHGRGTRLSLKRRVHWIGLKSLADLQVKNRHDHVTCTVHVYLVPRPLR